MTGQRHDLGASFARLTRAMFDAETPILRAHDVEMWDYAVLSALRDEAAPTQSELAAAVQRDKTRLIPILDRLEARGLLTRTPDPADRRNRVIALTDDGRVVLDACRTAIRAMEEKFLAAVPEAERRTFVEVLTRLTDRLQPPTTK
ncbi:MarR family winged helix-turn-helix transcriptional regulator [Actinophytocola sp.]|jgi:DNA-binding MarR family transcriptional regulator|uniref:MarR family winged helix-turn-helix transcriptional regulator n=1 Tax=Actinophytocola sp. TaxID=1872138 RepID=UPI002D6A700C|nr:MarR family transcriptional regulator [Actinophytocola sp.]HYQ67914.1 MarR family transcriptional regulator [Actinophytocola sp.]